MRRTHIALISFLLSLSVWLLFSWPLPRHLADGIPSSAQNIEKDHVIRMVHGDHLQLLYHFWLAGDMLAGKTPLFHNLYEFNTGNDSDRFAPGAYYAPASLVYGAIAALGGPALGWNLMGFLSLWLTLFALWRLVKRYVDDELVALSAAIVGILIPYPWAKLLGGSPTGCSTALIPLVYMGIDIAVREARVRGGVLAGGALLAAAFIDVHTFFFTVLFMPVWGLFVCLHSPNFDWFRSRHYIRAITRLLPLLAAIILAYAYTHYRQSYALRDTISEGSRSPHEIALYSPEWHNLFVRQRCGIHQHIHVGFVATATMALGLLSLLSDWRRKRLKGGKRTAAIGLLVIAIVAIALLACGVQSPDRARLFHLCRRVIPPYRKIRQPAKIFCMMSTFLTVMLGISLTSLLQRLRPHRRTALLSGWLLLTFISLLGITSPTICLLDKSNDAYAAIARNADDEDRPAHALVVPLWPGDSAWASLYQYYVSLYRIRMVNGYRPAVPKQYYDDVFLEYASANKGRLDDEQLRSLQDMGVGYVVLHENAFPDKVSPFPVAFTLKALLNHPRLRLLKQAEEVWAFKILTQPDPRPPLAEKWTFTFPSRRWELEHAVHGGAETLEDARAGRGAFLALRQPGDHATTRATYTIDDPGLRWLLRARGSGELTAATVIDDRTNHVETLAIESQDWTWLPVPTGDFRGHVRIGTKLALQQGTVDVDVLLLTTGEWRPIPPGESITIPAPCFFHAGHTTSNLQTVVLRPEKEPDHTIFYGPDLPLDPGFYMLRMTFRSPAPKTTRLGELEMGHGPEPNRTTTVFAGSMAEAGFEQKENLPLRIAFVYSREARVEIDSITLIHVDVGEQR